MLALLALLLAAAGPGVAAPAGAPVVSIDRPADADAVVTEASVRLRAELAAAGFDSRIVTCEVDPLAGPAECPRDETLASISLARAQGVTSIFVSSRLKSGLELRRHVRVPADDGGADATLLAVRAVELLRDLQVTVATTVATGAVDAEDPKPLEPFAQQPPAPAPLHWYLLAGAGTLMLPWSGKPTFDPTLGALIGVGVGWGPRALAVFEAAGPFANSLPVAQQPGSPNFSDRTLYQMVAGVSLRVGRASAVEGLFGAPFFGLRYTHLQLSAPNLAGQGQSMFPVVGIGVGYTGRLTRSLLLTAELDLDDSSELQVSDVNTHQLLTQSSQLSVAFNLTAALALF